MRKPARPNILLDRMHKGFVCGCIGITLYGTYLLGWRFYRYLAVVRPQNQQKEIVSKQSLLAEGSSDNLTDSAPQIKA